MVVNITISINVDFGKEQIKDFKELEKKCYATGLQLARELLKEVLEETDLHLLEERDKSRYRAKGKAETCIRTLMGNVVYKRRVYVDTENESRHCVHLLDAALKLKKVGLVSENVSTLIASRVCESTYRATAKSLDQMTGLSLSHQAVWTIAQRAGETVRSRLNRYSELAKIDAGAGEIKTELLYLESDGIWLKLQGKSRQEHGAAKEMKVGIAYDGVNWKGKGKCVSRRTLDNKLALAGFMTAEQFRAIREGLIANRFDVSGIKLRILNGDGASWIHRKNGDSVIDVLDEFHRNKKITECVLNREFADTLMTLLREKRVDDLLESIAAQINSIEDEVEISKLQELQTYFTENKGSLLSYYDRGIEIPPTRNPGEVHHARLGSMESNVYTLIGNRMKDGRACWSIDGANNLSALLCAYHTADFKYLFAELPGIPDPEPDWVDDGHAISASKMPTKEGKGYEYVGNISTTNFNPLLKGISNFSPLSNLSFSC